MTLDAAATKIPEVDMGYNSVVFICNDVFSAVERDPDGWWKKTREALMTRECMRGDTKGYGFGYSANGFQALWNEHADVTGLIAVGQNHATVIHMGRGYHHTPEGQVELLRQAAAELGYELHAMPRRRLAAALARFKLFHNARQNLKEFVAFFEKRLSSIPEENHGLPS